MARPQPSALALRLGSAPLVIPEIEADNVELNGLLAGRRSGDALQHELHLKLTPGSSRVRGRVGPPSSPLLATGVLSGRLTLSDLHLLYNADRNADPIVAPTLSEEDRVRGIIMFLGHPNFDNGLLEVSRRQVSGKFRRGYTIWVTKGKNLVQA
jgi:hypothetical protein